MQCDWDAAMIGRAGRTHLHPLRPILHDWENNQLNARTIQALSKQGTSQQAVEQAIKQSSKRVIGE